MKHYEISEHVDKLNSKKPIYNKRLYIDEAVATAVLLVAVAIIFKWLFWN